MSQARRFLLTRPAGQSDILADALRRAGIEPVLVPAIAIRPPQSYRALDHALAELERYDWILFTSANGVRALRGRAAAISPGRSLPQGTAVAAVGPGTAKALAELGIGVVWSPSEALGLRAAAELPASPGVRVLWVRGDLASPAIGKRLHVRGLLVDEVVGYHTVEAPAASVQPLAAAWREGLDGVVLASASAARGFTILMRTAGIGNPGAAFLVVAIGPVTADAAAKAGWPAHLVARDHSASGIVQIITEGSARGAASI